MPPACVTTLCPQGDHPQVYAPWAWHVTKKLPLFLVGKLPPWWENCLLGGKTASLVGKLPPVSIPQEFIKFAERTPNKMFFLVKKIDGLGLKVKKGFSLKTCFETLLLT